MNRMTQNEAARCGAERVLADPTASNEWKQSARTVLGLPTGCDCASVAIHRLMWVARLCATQQPPEA